MATSDAYLMSCHYKILNDTLYLNKTCFSCVNIGKLGICDSNINT